MMALSYYSEDGRKAYKWGNREKGHYTKGVAQSSVYKTDA